VLGGIVNQGGLHAVLDRVQSLGLEVIEITSDPAGRD